MKNTAVISVEAEVKRIIMEKLGVSEDKLTPESNLMDDIGADSLDLYETFMTIEKEFKITIPEEQAEKIKTVGQMIACVQSNIK